MERQPRRRRRPALSCLECRRRKIKCNRNEPCAHCVSAKLRCTYKIYTDEPTVRQQPRVDGLWGETSSPLAPVPSPVAPVQQLSTSRPVDDLNNRLSESQVAISSSSSTTAVAAAQNDTPSSLGSNDPQPSARGQDVEPGLVSIMHRGLRPDKSSASSPINGLSESGRGILARQLGLQDSQIILNKTRILGWSLRIGTAPEFAPIVACYVAAASTAKATSPPDTELGTLHAQIWTLMQKCKSLARTTKVGRPSRWLSAPDFDLTPPPRDVADTMAALYFESFESTSRILHAPSFWKEYQRFWDHPESITTDLRLKVLLVIGTGSSMSEHIDRDAGLRNKVQQWIYAAQTWLSGPLEKDRLDVTGIQIYCLTILARQIFSVGGDLVWGSVGSLIHMAMQIGLHRDPKHIPAMSVLKAEVRRRLWATILEMVAQASLDSAMPPRISFDEFDTEAPSNVNDDEIDESTTTIQPHPRSTYTSMSMQLMLLDLLPTRLRILNLLNGLHSELSYLDALALNSEITDQYRTCSSFMRENEQAGATAFHRNMLDYLVRRFLIPLHCPFAGEARSNPLFYYSLKVSLDSAMSIIRPEPDERFSRIMALSGGMFREGIRYALTIVTRELIAQVEAQRGDGTLHRNTQYLQLLKQAVSEMLSLSIERIRKGETNVKGPMFLSMIVAQTEAIEAGTDCELKVAQAAKDSLDLCYTILRARVGAISSPSPANTGLTPTSLDGGQGGYDLDLDLDWNFFLPGASFA
ncbi:hypothetical protein F5Y05DRAFT_402099 [Hypoxylon sp. FL0543]|nr:hypothetical protein F5Y05DRAFT_402099 [Hypoxylon sp. FL0543]